MKTLLITAAFAVLGTAALAAPVKSTDGNANYGCGWQPAENGNWLTFKGDCAGIPVVTGGYTSEVETFVVEGECGPETISRVVTRESRGNRAESGIPANRIE